MKPIIFNGLNLGYNGAMSDELIVWLTEMLKRRHWSQHELARQSGVSQARISQVLAGNTEPSASFCVDIAHALDEAPEKLLRLAGILSPSEDDLTLTELIEVSKSLTPQQREELLRYAKYLKD